MQELWIRLGVQLHITRAEAEALLGSVDPSAPTETFHQILKEGRFTVEGESYIPAPAVEKYNAKYDAEYVPADIELDF